MSVDRPPLNVAGIANLRVVAETGSTNADVVELAGAGAPEGTVVAAEHQVTGRGRLDRAWTSPPRAGLTFSVLLRPGDDIPARRWSWLPLLTGCAVVEGVGEVTTVQARLKWPNDVLVGDRKVCGILLERADTPTGPAAVLGIGLNVTTSLDELPSSEATSLALEGAIDLDRGALLVAILDDLWRMYHGWRSAGGDPLWLHETYLTYSATVGRQVRVQLGSDSWIEGLAADIDHDGRLVVENAEGKHALGAGDVVHVR